MKSFLILLVLPLVFSACSSKKLDPESVIARPVLTPEEIELSCLDRLGPDFTIKTLSKTKEWIGFGSSYAVTALAYTSDVVIVIGGQAAISILACTVSPQGACLGKDLNTMLQKSSRTFPFFGPMTAKATSKWGCPLANEMSQSLRRVVTCQTEQGDTKAGSKQLALIKNDHHFWKCLSDKEQDRWDELSSKKEL